MEKYDNPLVAKDESISPPFLYDNPLVGEDDSISPPFLYGFMVLLNLFSPWIWMK